MQVFDIRLDFFDPENRVSAIDFRSQGVRVKQSKREILAQLRLTDLALCCGRAKGT
jgi:hypothetical protein